MTLSNEHRNKANIFIRAKLKDLEDPLPLPIIVPGAQAIINWVLDNMTTLNNETILDTALAAQDLALRNAELARLRARIAELESR